MLLDLDTYFFENFFFRIIASFDEENRRLVAQLISVEQLDTFV